MLFLDKLFCLLYNRLNLESVKRITAVKELIDEHKGINIVQAPALIPGGMS